MKRRQRMYAGQYLDGDDSPYYSHFYSSQELVAFCGAPEIHKVELREADEDEEVRYWGWEDVKDKGKWSMIWPSKLQLEVCFTYGMAHAIKCGQGRPVRLIVKKV